MNNIYSDFFFNAKYIWSINLIDPKFTKMKLLGFLFFLFLTTISAQWETQSPVPTSLDIRGIASPTVEKVFIATNDNPFDNGGALFESNDGGINWVQRNIPESLGDPFNGLYFYDDQNGWAFGNNNYRTTDSGLNWFQIPLLGSTYFMKFYTPSFGLATGNFGRMISLDGGSNWIPSPNDIYTFDFANNQTGLGVAETGVYKTTDGGATFSNIYSGDAKAVVYLSENTAVAVVDNNLTYSIDGGSTWNVSTSAEGRNRLFSISPSVVLAYGRSGTSPNFDDRIFRSTDGGQTWTDLGEIIIPGSFNASIIFARSSEQNISATDGAGNMYYSSDAGANWALSFESPEMIQPSLFSSAEPIFADSQTGYYGFGSGYVIKTTDGGVSWNQISSGYGSSLNDIVRFENGSLIAVGDNGTILNNSNGNSGWVLQNALTSANLKAIHIINQTEAALVDESAQVFFSTDGGLNWTAANSKPSGLTSAEDIYFTDNQNGWILGQGSNQSALFHTTDGGTTWNPTPEIPGSYKSLDVKGSSIWAVNSNGRYYRSVDNGQTWTQNDLPGSPFQIESVEFFDESTGYVVGWAGYAAKSTDGGETWEILPTPNSNEQLTDVYLLDQNQFWVSTNNNKAYYSANGGQGWAALEIDTVGFGDYAAIAANSSGNAWIAGGQGSIKKFVGTLPPPLNQPPNAAFSFESTGLTVTFTDNSSDPDGVISQWAWDFGDSTLSSEQNPVHTFDSADTYIVRLTVTDDDGSTGSAVKFIAVQLLPGGTFGDFTEITPLDSLFVTPQDEDFWVVTTAPADFDNDGDIDIAVLGYYVVYNQSVENKLVLFENNGLGSGRWNFNYFDVPLDNVGIGSSDMAWGDVDNDGYQDLLIGTDGKTLLYSNDNGALNLTDTVLPGYFEDNDQAEFDLNSLSWADYDNDGDLDILIPSVFDFDSLAYRTALLRNDGPNGGNGISFTEIDSAFDATAHAQSFWADYDNDQDLDLLLVNIAPLTNESFIRRYRNDGNGNFSGEDILGSLYLEHGEAQWGDYDADGDLDILIAGSILDTNGIFNLAVRIYKNDNDIYSPIPIITNIAADGWFDITAAAWADYDADGDVDVLIAGHYNSGQQIEGRTRIYKNEGNDNFVDSGNDLPAPRASGSRGGTFSWLDLDGDADLDYFIAGQYFVAGGNGLVESQIHAYINDPSSANLSPETPTSLNASVQVDGSVIFTWTPAFDDKTPTNAITYEFNLYNNGVPQSIPQHTPKTGNIGAVSQWQLSGLDDGQYQWTLRAVDAAYSASTIINGDFTIGNITNVDFDNPRSLKYAIEQNYPNPFNPTTTINYSIPSEGIVEIKLFNIIGEEVATLMNKIHEPGYYSVDFNAQTLASGIYLYRLRAGDYVATRKMMILK